MTRKIKRREWRVEHEPDPVSPEGVLVFLADTKAEAVHHLNHCFGVIGGDGTWTDGSGRWNPKSLKMIGWGDDVA